MYKEKGRESWRGSKKKSIKRKGEKAGEEVRKKVPYKEKGGEEVRKKV